MRALRRRSIFTPKLNELGDQSQAAPTVEEYTRLSQEVQRYIVRHMIQINATMLPFMQAARD
jgi:hypothetical protein